GRVGGDRVVADADELVAVLVDDVRATDVRIKQALAGVVDERAERGPRPAGADRVTGGGSGAAVRRRPHEVVPVVVPDDVAALIPVPQSQLGVLTGGGEAVVADRCAPEAAVVGTEVEVVLPVDVGEAGRVDGAEEALAVVVRTGLDDGLVGRGEWPLG